MQLSCVSSLNPQSLSTSRWVQVLELHKPLEETEIQRAGKEAENEHSARVRVSPTLHRRDKWKRGRGTGKPKP